MREEGGEEVGYYARLIGSLVSRPHFLCPPEKWVWSTAYSIFVQVAGMLAHCSFLI